jgi:hypothetical protein
MKKLSAVDFQEIRTWIYQNARPVELALWQYHFEGGKREAVLSALKFYQNEDGGFGHALEADSWNPNSSPVTTLTAMGILDEIGYIDEENPVILGIYKFLESGVHCSENGWFFNIPSNNEYPHAPWWTYNKESNEVEGIGLTANISGLLLLHADKGSQLYKKAISFTDLLISKLLVSEKYGDMGIGGYCRLLEKIKLAGLTDRYDCNILEDRLKHLVHASIIRDTSKWVYYSVRPSEYITSKDSIFYRDNEDIVETELDYLIDTRPSNGVWDITWSWFDNNEKYPKEFAISENWWKSEKAIRKLLFLQSFGRIEDGLILQDK